MSYNASTSALFLPIFFRVCSFISSVLTLKENSLPLMHKLLCCHYLHGISHLRVPQQWPIVQECPCAVVAAERLVSLGVSGGDVAGLMVAGVDGQTGPPDW